MTNIADRTSLLEARLLELDRRLHKIDHQLGDPVTKDWEDRAIEREGDEVLEDMGIQGLKEMEQIRAALSRIEDGSYGECMKCAGEISEDRLNVVPHAALCQTCA